jgi:CheY-like chemotaxis protein
VRVVIAEDHFLLREGLTRLLSAYGHQVAAADNGDDLLNAIREHQPDIAVVDVRLPPGFTDEGLRAALAARAEHAAFPVMVLSQYVEQLYARELLADMVGPVTSVYSVSAWPLMTFLGRVPTARPSRQTTPDAEPHASLATRQALSTASLESGMRRLISEA